MEKNIFEKFLFDKGIDLSKEGTSGYLLSYDNTLEAINILERLQIPILGGDVFVKENDKYRLTHDNWSIESSNNVNSFLKSREYISLFADKKNISYFMIVTK
ncbi:MAG: Imm40 family immunity protein [Bacteroidota bacterium]